MRVIPEAKWRNRFFSGQIMMPIGDILIAVFAGWIAPKVTMRDELYGLNDWLFSCWRVAVGYVAPLSVGIALIIGVSTRF